MVAPFGIYKKMSPKSFEKIFEIFLVEFQMA